MRFEDGSMQIVFSPFTVIERAYAFTIAVMELRSEDCRMYTTSYHNAGKLRVISISPDATIILKLRFTEADLRLMIGSAFPMQFRKIRYAHCWSDSLVIEELGTKDEKYKISI